MSGEVLAPATARKDPPKAFPYWNLLYEMTRCEFKLRDQGTALGFFWTLLNPAIQFAVMYELFTKWMGSQVPNYALYLIIGLLQWGFFANGTCMALMSLRAKQGIAQGFKFPREIIVLSTIGTILWSHLLELSIVLAFLLLFTHTLSWTWIYVPLLIAIEVLWTAGISLFLARWAVEFRDLDRIWSILMQAGFFVTPVFYPLKIIAKSKRFWLELNPLVHIMDGMRACLLRNQTPPDWIVALLVVGGGGLMYGGLLWFRAHEGTIVDHL